MKLTKLEREYRKEVKQLADTVKCIRSSSGTAWEWRTKCNGTCGKNLKFHTVRRMDNGRFWCNCPGADYGHLCKHVLAVAMNEIRTMGYRITFTKNQDGAKKQKRHFFMLKTEKTTMYIVMRRTAQAIFDAPWRTA